MNPTPLHDSLEDLILGLRGVTAPAEWPAHRPRHSAAWAVASVGVTGAVAVGAAALLMRPSPALAKGFTWAQIARATAEAGVRHGVSTEPRGFQRVEFWTDGAKWATVTTLMLPESKTAKRTNPATKMVFEYRSDGVDSWRFDGSDQSGPTPQKPNRANVGYRAALGPGRRGPWRDTGHLYPGGRDALGTLLAEKDARVLSRKALGEGEELRVRLDDPFLNRGVQIGTIVVDARGRITEARGFGSFTGTVFRYDYPASVQQVVFEPRPQIFPALVVDRGPMRARVLAGMKGGLGTNRGVTLRAVLLDSFGDLYTLYSGALPPGSLPRSVRVEGVSVSKPFGPKAFVRGAPSHASVVGVRLGGMAVTPHKKLGERITLRVPAEEGEAVFRGVRVERIVSLYDFAYDIGLAKRKPE